MDVCNSPNESFSQTDTNDLFSNESTQNSKFSKTEEVWMIIYFFILFLVILLGFSTNSLVIRILAGKKDGTSSRPPVTDLIIVLSVNDLLVNVWGTPSCTVTIGGSKGGRQGRAPPLGSKFFHFHAVFGKKLKNNSTFGSWRPPLGKILDPPLVTSLAKEWIFGDTLCQVHAFAMSCAGFFSECLVTIIAIERFLVIVPTKFKYLVTRRNTKISIIFCLSSSIVTAAIPVLGMWSEGLAITIFLRVIREQFFFCKGGEE